MKSWGIEKRGAIANLKCIETAKPLLAPGRILVKVKAASVNMADIKIIKGGVGRFLHANTFPLLMGYDFAGYVEAVGEGVDAYKAGDQVFGFLPYASNNAQGSYSEYVLAKPEEVALSPRNISFEEAASFPTTACTALSAIREIGKVKPGQKVLINGASGGVGCYAAQIAAILGADVVGTCSAGKMDFVTELNVRAIDYNSTPLTSIKETFDLIFDAASTSSFLSCSKLLNDGGKYMTLLPSPALLLGFVASLFSYKTCHFIYGKSESASLTQLSDWIERSSLLPKVDKVYPVDQLAQALRFLESGKVKGKLAVTVS